MKQKLDIVFGLFGTGGCARSIMPFAQKIARKRFKCTRIVFVETAPQRKIVNGFSVLSEKEFFSLKAKKKYFNIGIAKPDVREKLVKRCLKADVVPLDLYAPEALVYGNNDIGEGAILCAHTTVTSNVKIGKYFHGNLYSYVEHDCVIGDYVTFAPRVSCNGNVHIGSYAYIGTGAVIRQGTPEVPLVIGEGAVVGMGAVVTKDVPPGATVIGNPARIQKRTAPKR